MPLQFGSRIFAPRLFTSLLTVVLLALLISLGRWQLERAHAKQVLFDEFAAGSDATRSIDGTTPPVARYQHVSASGRYDSARQILIDNMTDPEGHAGYYVLTPLHLTSGQWLLVNRGWVPLGASRAVSPTSASRATSCRCTAARTICPNRASAWATPRRWRPPIPWWRTIQRSGRLPNYSEKHRGRPPPSRCCWTPANRKASRGAGRRPGFAPMRHLAYAVQWFGLALALVIIYLITNTRRSTPRPA